MAARNYRGAKLPFEFVPIPKPILRLPEFMHLPASSKALMLDLASTYNGRNNGQLCTGIVAMREHGWSSRSKLQRAKETLILTSFCKRTRMGRGGQDKLPEWVGFTWWKLDFHPSMRDDLGDPRDWPYLNFVVARLADPNQVRFNGKTVESLTRKRSDSGGRKRSISPESGQAFHR